MQKLRPSTALDVLKSESPSLAKLKATLNDDGENAVKAILSILVSDLVNFFSIGKTMNVPQIGQTIDLILEDYSTMKPDDFKLCFTRAKKGYYGKVYDRIDGQVILGWLSQYDFEKADEIEHYREKESSNHKIALLAPVHADECIPMPEWFKEGMKSLFEKKNKEAPASQRKPHPVNDMVQSWINRFNLIWMNQDYEGGKRFIKKYGRHLDINEYLEYKSQQYNRILTRL